METLGKAVLPWLARFNVGCVYSTAVTQPAQSQRHELRSMVHPQRSIHTQLLALFATYPGQVFDRRTLLRQVWNRPDPVGNREMRTVDVHVRWLREKIEPCPERPEWLVTVHGVGYKYVG